MFVYRTKLVKWPVICPTPFFNEEPVVIHKICASPAAALPDVPDGAQVIERVEGLSFDTRQCLTGIPLQPAKSSS
jgi:hypothetical protein